MQTWTHAPDPVDHLDLLVEIHHEDCEEDHSEDHLADGHSGVASIKGRSVADDDDETDDLRVIEVGGRGLGKTVSTQINHLT